MANKTDFDTPWKDILDTHFEAFMEMCYPKIAQIIDWAKGYESLDKELTAITKDAKIGKRIVDKLMKVWQCKGEETWILLHLEVQGQPEAIFSERMFVYYYRVLDRYKKPVVSLALLIDDNPHWRPLYHEYSLADCRLRFDFITVKLLDYEAQREILLESTNPFVIVILAQLDALKTCNNEQQRFIAKFNLTRRLYEKGLHKAEIISLFIFIDYVMTLPEPLELQYSQALEQLEEEKKMAYITSIERIGIKKGIQQGLAQGREEGLEQGLEQGEKIILLCQLQRKFGTIPERYRHTIEQANSKTLLTWAENLIMANSLAEVFKESETA